MALPEVKQTATEARLAALSLPTGGCLEAGRRAALARVQEMGLPGARDEYWKYTRPETLVQAAAPEAAVFDSGEAPMFNDFDRLKVVFVDGVFDADASDDLSLEGVTIERLADLAAKDLHWAKDIYGVLEARGQNPVERPLAALNTAFATDGVVVHVTGKPSKPINLVYKHSATNSDAILHHVVKVDSGAEATILENGPAASRFQQMRWRSTLPMAAAMHLVRAHRAATTSAARRPIMFARLGTESGVQVLHSDREWRADPQRGGD